MTSKMIIANAWAIHDIIPRIIETERIKYADPINIIKASAIFLNQNGFVEKAKKLEVPLDICLYL